MLRAGARNGLSLHRTAAELGASLSPGKRGEDKDSGTSSGATEVSKERRPLWHGLAGSRLSEFPPHPGNPRSA